MVIHHVLTRVRGQGGLDKPEAISKKRIPRTHFISLESGQYFRLPEGEPVMPAMMW